jgi:hypothetical protein
MNFSYPIFTYFWYPGDPWIVLCFQSHYIYSLYVVSSYPAGLAWPSLPFLPPGICMICSAITNYIG